jgi:protein-L-isoaspartate O-methyltransferase
MAKLVGNTGVVCGVDHIDELVDFSKKNTENLFKSLSSKKSEDYVKNEYGKIYYRVGDGRNGWEIEDKKAPDYIEQFDAIHVGATVQRMH